MKLLLECDLGEGEPAALTRALMRRIDAANVACGGHAGSMGSMELCARLAKRHRVRLGAHPGAWPQAPGDFGRAAVSLSPAALELLLVHQVGALERVAREVGLRLSHVKLHGALYHAADADERLARAYLAALRRFWPKAAIIARAGGPLEALARRCGMAVLGEVFADRAYRDDGTLLPRGEPGATVADPKAVARRVWRLAARGEVETATGSFFRIEGRERVNESAVGTRLHNQSRDRQGAAPATRLPDRTGRSLAPSSGLSARRGVVAALTGRRLARGRFVRTF